MKREGGYQKETSSTLLIKQLKQRIGISIELPLGPSTQALSIKVSCHTKPKSPAEQIKDKG
jgi:hypothetical protein